MDIFITGLPEATTGRELNRFLRENLAKIGIAVFNCHKIKGKVSAILTLADMDSAASFLSLHGSLGPRPSNSHTPQPLVFKGKKLICTRSNKPASLDPLMILSLQDEQRELREREKRTSRQKKGENRKKSTGSLMKTFHIDNLRCGLWDFESAEPIFDSCYEDDRSGTLKIGVGKLLITLHASAKTRKSVQIEIPYSIIDSAIIGDRTDPCLTVTLDQSPAMIGLNSQTKPQPSQQPNASPDFLALYKSLSALTLDSTSYLSASQPGPRPWENIDSIPRLGNDIGERLDSLHSAHTQIAGICLVYQFTISNPASVRELPRTVSEMPAAPDVRLVRTISRDGRSYLLKSIKLLKQTLATYLANGWLPYPILFQIQACFQNAILHPHRLILLLPAVRDLAWQNTTYAVVEALQFLWNSIPRAGPSADSSAFSVENMQRILRERVSAFNINTSPLAGGSMRHEHLGIIHRVRITPCGIYLEGPFLEVKNRVIRKYPLKTDYFVRVEFSDEDGGGLLRRPNLDNRLIYRKRFLGTLNGSIDIAGRSAKFLGFSNSSLRSSMCWFMMPFSHQQQLLLPNHIISDLGDFSHLRSPAKTAARIGQAFSDATDTIPIPAACERTISDIERNGRCFTDGVGQISVELLKEVWVTLRKSRKQPASCLQVRYRGAKGMLALNSILQGKQICLRPSMIKFEGSEDRKLEITGANYRALPVFLNRQLIKILEDLDVPRKSFIDLQETAIEELSCLQGRPNEAATFLEKNNIGTAAQISALIKELDRIGIHFQDDQFLRQVVALSALVQLRDLKYRARIPVPNASTLYGIIDETGLLKENEVYVVTTDHKRRKTNRTGWAIITRAPAMHPGDVQFVYAVNVPDDSPLRDISNCVVFSQHGQRDLPSKLSGGDLDGDLFGVIFDKSLWPRKISEAADYPRLPPLDICRSVEAHDITEFFVKFMEIDQLGYICNAHTIVADRMEEGTVHQDCLQLAELASTAVDYAKTGIAPDMSKFPRNAKSRIRPDFMANAPDILIQDGVPLEWDVDNFNDEEGDEDDILNPDAHRIRYYPSPKVLGVLFRNIDEKRFFRTMKDDLKGSVGDSRNSVLHRVWSHVEKETRLFQWKHHWDFALNVKDAYEEFLKSTMYNFSPHRRTPLTEKEAFAGVILGRKGGIPDRHVRDKIPEMKDELGRSFAYIREWIVYGDAGRPDIGSELDDVEELDEILGVGASSGDGEALERSIACLAVGIREPGGFVRGRGKLESFPYVAATVCLKELAKFKGVYFN